MKGWFEAIKLFGYLHMKHFWFYHVLLLPNEFECFVFLDIPIHSFLFFYMTVKNNVLGIGHHNPHSYSPTWKDYYFLKSNYGWWKGAIATIWYLNCYSTQNILDLRNIMPLQNRELKRTKFFCNPIVPLLEVTVSVSFRIN